MSLVVAFYVVLVGVAFVTRHLRQSVGEVFPRYGESVPQPSADVDPQAQVQSDVERPDPLLAIISTNHPEIIIERIKAQFRQDLTSLDPNNTSGTRTTLMLPVEVTEVSTLKALVTDVDEAGVVVVIPTQNVFPSGI